MYDDNIYGTYVCLHILTDVDNVLNEPNIILSEWLQKGCEWIIEIDNEGFR